MRPLPLAVVCLLAGCAGARPGAQARPRVAVDWERGGVEPLKPRAFAIPGERLIYEGRWMGAAIGRVVVEVGGWSAGQGRRLLGGRSVAESDGLSAVFSQLWWELETELDVDSGMPVRAIDRWSIVMGGDRDHGTYEHTWSAGETRHNLHSAVSAVRGWDPAPGERRRLSVEIGGWFDVELASAGGEYLQEFERPAIRYEGRAFIGKTYGFTFFVSDDAERVPLRLDMETHWGPVSLVLRRYDRAGDRPTQRFDGGPSPL